MGLTMSEAYPPSPPPPGWDVRPWHFLQLIYINYVNVYVYAACTHLN